jgi:hypothetical protein
MAQGQGKHPGKADQALEDALEQIKAQIGGAT